MTTVKNSHRLAALVVFVCTLALAGCAEKKADPPKAERDAKAEKEKPKAKSKPKERENPKPEDEKPKDDAQAVVKEDSPSDVVISADELLSEFKADVEAAKSKYKNRWLDVTGRPTQGRFSTFATGFVDGKIIDKKVYNIDFVLDNQSIQCVLPVEDAGRVAIATKVRIRAQFSRDGTFLVNCVVLETQAADLPRFTTAEFTERFSADPVKFRQQYNRRRMVLSGKVKAVANNALGAHVTLLEPDGKPEIKFVLDKQDPHAASIKVGQEVEIVGSAFLLIKFVKNDPEKFEPTDTTFNISSVVLKLTP